MRKTFWNNILELICGIIEHERILIVDDVMEKE